MSAGRELRDSIRFDDRSIRQLEWLGSRWWTFFLLGMSLSAAGMAAIAVPIIAADTNIAAVSFLGVLVVVSGAAIIVNAFFIGRWSGFLIEVFAGVLYVSCGFLMSEEPRVSSLAITLFVATLFIVLGVFRIVGALAIRYPMWGWLLLNGAVTLLAGLIVLRQFPGGVDWLLGLLVGLELLFNGWTYLMLGFASQRISITLANMKLFRNSYRPSTLSSITLERQLILDAVLTETRHLSEDVQLSDSTRKHIHQLLQDRSNRRQVVGFAELRGVDDNDVLDVEVAYRLQAGIREQMQFRGSELPIEVPVGEVELDISVRAANCTIGPHRIQRLQVIPGTDSGIDFFLTPTKPGPLPIEVDFFFQRHWLGMVRLSATVRGQPTYAVKG